MSDVVPLNRCPWCDQPVTGVRLMNEPEPMDFRSNRILASRPLDAIPCGHPVVPMYRIERGVTTVRLDKPQPTPPVPVTPRSTQ